MEDNLYTYSNAVEDFRRARFQADLKEFISRLTGESTQLLSYDDVRQKLRLQGGISRGLRDIPLDAIVGSVGRYSDFSRDFLPRRRVQSDRWARVKVAASGMIGLPPIEVYQIGQVYFVQDGNHRVSVARQLDAKYIQAFVTEVESDIPLEPTIQPDELILKAEYSQFLEQTNLKHLRPGADLSVTEPGKYPTLLEHIDVHCYFMGLDFQRSISYEEAVIHWYDQVYLPVVEIIRQRGFLRGFPGRTETDFYLWISENRRELEEEYGFSIRTEFIISQLDDVNRSGWMSRLGDKILDLVIPANLEDGSPSGDWRNQTYLRSGEQLFRDLLVPINGKEDGWYALEQGIRIAQREQAVLHGLHVSSFDASQQLDQESIQTEFQRRCIEGGIRANLVLTEGDVVGQICLRSAATDLVVVNISYPPSAAPISRLKSGFRNLLQRCPRPILATPKMVSSLKNALLAFDGSPKAMEALFVSTYLAQKWGTHLSVVTIKDDERIDETTSKSASDYLESNGVHADFLLTDGDPGKRIMDLYEELGCDLIIMGGYGYSPILEVILGSTVDKVLRQSKVPVLVCR